MCGKNVQRLESKVANIFNKELSLISVLFFYPELDVIEFIEESVEGFSKNDLFSRKLVIKTLV